jgi:hypothetical protein
MDDNRLAKIAEMESQIDPKIGHDRKTGILDKI